MVDIKRFTLREEYFGGILHDSKEITCHLLSPSEFNILKKVVLATEGVDLNSQELIQIAKKFMNIGALEINQTEKRCSSTSIRYVKPPEELPSKCLTAPIRVYHTYTQQCNLRCPQCCVSGSVDYSEQRMTVGQIATVMQKFYEVGTMEWRFTGGEPTSCVDFVDSLKIAKGLGMGVMLNTNGCWSDELLEYLPEAGIGEIIVSLEGKEKTNDRRRSQGVYHQVVNVLNRLFKHNHDNPADKIRVTINMTIAKDNVSEIEFVVRLAATYGFNINFVPLRPYGRTLDGLAKSMLTTSEFMRFTEKVQRLREDPEIKNSGSRIIHRNMDLFCPDYPNKSQQPYPFNYSDCGALSTGFGLSPDGRVNACSFLMNDSQFVGPSMLDVSVREAWLHPSMEYFRQAIKVGCLKCGFYMNQCEGKCRAMVLANGGKIVDGKLIGQDPYCFKNLM